MTNTQRTAKAHSNMFTISLLALALYLIWPVFFNEHSEAPQQTREEVK